MPRFLTITTLRGASNPCLSPKSIGCEACLATCRESQGGTPTPAARERRTRRDAVPPLPELPPLTHPLRATPLHGRDPSYLRPCSCTATPESRWHVRNLPTPAALCRLVNGGSSPPSLYGYKREPLNHAGLRVAGTQAGTRLPPTAGRTRVVGRDRPGWDPSTRIYVRVLTTHGSDWQFTRPGESSTAYMPRQTPTHPRNPSPVRKKRLHIAF